MCAGAICADDISLMMLHQLGLRTAASHDALLAAARYIEHLARDGSKVPRASSSGNTGKLEEAVARGKVGLGHVVRLIAESIGL
jgi:hypothetical protein